VLRRLGPSSIDEGEGYAWRLLFSEANITQFPGVAPQSTMVSVFAGVQEYAPILHRMGFRLKHAQAGYAKPISLRFKEIQINHNPGAISVEIYPPAPLKEGYLFVSFDTPWGIGCGHDFLVDQQFVEPGEVDNKALISMMVMVPGDQSCVYRIGENPVLPEAPPHVSATSLNSKDPIHVTNAIWFEE
jgi:hypothetical protein